MVFLPSTKLEQRRRAMSMTHAVLAARSGVSEPTVKRILGGRLGEASFANVSAIAATLGLSLTFDEVHDVEDLRRQQARAKAEYLARLVQGTSALENQAVNDAEYQRLVEKSYHELLAGPNRRLWST